MAKWRFDQTEVMDDKLLSLSPFHWYCGIYKYYMYYIVQYSRAPYIMYLKIKLNLFSFIVRGLYVSFK